MRTHFSVMSNFPRDGQKALSDQVLFFCLKIKHKEAKKKKFLGIQKGTQNDNDDINDKADRKKKREKRLKNREDDAQRGEKRRKMRSSSRDERIKWNSSIDI